MVKMLTMRASSFLEVVCSPSSSGTEVFIIEFDQFEVGRGRSFLFEPFGVVESSSCVPRVQFSFPARKFGEFDPFKGINGGLVILLNGFILPPGVCEFSVIKRAPVISR